MPVFALVDCNNFYASCERAFNPKLIGRPVVVLSNNDGCVVARSAEAKALKIPMAAPYFKIEKEFRAAGGVALSSNYALYADMSNRVMTILAEYSPQQEAYSIDECFLEMSGHRDLTKIGRDIREKVLRWTGLPVCAGFGSTKTLAKLANHVAKKNAGWSGVCDLTELAPGALDQVVGGLEVGEVWGVGRRIEARLGELGITTVRQLRDADSTRIRKEFSVVLERTVQELRGTACLAMELVAPAKRQIMVSRSFGAPVYDLEELRQAVATFVARAAEKLRGQGSCAGSLMIFAGTSGFRERDPQYSKSLTIPIMPATADTLLLTRAASFGIERIFKPGFAYARAGVMLGEIVPVAEVPIDLFTEVDPKVVARMALLDSINRKFGKNMLRTATMDSGERAWDMKQSRRSPRWTTCWDELPVVRAG